MSEKLNFKDIDETAFPPKEFCENVIITCQEQSSCNFNLIKQTIKNLIESAKNNLDSGIVFEIRRPSQSNPSIKIGWYSNSSMQSDTDFYDHSESGNYLVYPPHLSGYFEVYKGKVE